MLPVKRGRWGPRAESVRKRREAVDGAEVREINVVEPGVAKVVYDLSVVFRSQRATAIGNAGYDLRS